ncbi:MAG: DnaJ domain-containing protein [Pseudomonadota bacterium]
MADDYEYEPRFGFDIRASGGRAQKKTRARTTDETNAVTCDYPGCTQKATVKVPKSPREQHIRLALCTEHAREHNRNWNFFEGMSDAEAAALREAAFYGERPTWKMSDNARGAAAARAAAGGRRSIRDPFDILGEDGAAAATAPPSARKVTKLQAQAFRTLDLPENAEDAAIRKRYAELVKRFHPDANQGDRSTEERLQSVIKAYGILKKAGLCK